MSQATELLAREFVCAHCGNKGARTQELAMSGTGISRLFEIQPYRYTFVSCTNCGYTEVFDLDILEGRDDLGTFLDALFMD